MDVDEQAPLCLTSYMFYFNMSRMTIMIRLGLSLLLLVWSAASAFGDQQPASASISKTSGSNYDNPEDENSVYHYNEAGSLNDIVEGGKGSSTKTADGTISKLQEDRQESDLLPKSSSLKKRDTASTPVVADGGTGTGAPTTTSRVDHDEVSVPETTPTTSSEDVDGKGEDDQHAKTETPIEAFDRWVFGGEMKKENIEMKAKTSSTLTSTSKSTASATKTDSSSVSRPNDATSSDQESTEAVAAGPPRRLSLSEHLVNFTISLALLSLTLLPLAGCLWWLILVMVGQYRLEQESERILLQLDAGNSWRLQGMEGEQGPQGQAEQRSEPILTQQGGKGGRNGGGGQARASTSGNIRTSPQRLTNNTIRQSASTGGISPGVETAFYLSQAFQLSPGQKLSYPPSLSSSKQEIEIDDVQTTNVS
ncbi:unnamed protein product [Amoebophrya sp. A25]|nr:unnamed protein product [Amoebophrya sp. A25]|eukprot:GSA25T00004769001.1